MNTNEKDIIRIKFKIEIYEADGQRFEDLFTKIMDYKEEDFQQIKPHGNRGDGGCDGVIPSKGIYYQVHAPEGITKSVSRAIKKLKDDFNKLKDNWKNIKEFYFVINDKYKGVSRNLFEAVQEIKETYTLNEAVL